MIILIERYERLIIKYLLKNYFYARKLQRII